MFDLKLVKFQDANHATRVGVLINVGSKFYKVVTIGYPVRVIKIPKEDGSKLVEVKGSIRKMKQGIRKCVRYQGEVSKEVRELIKGVY